MLNTIKSQIKEVKSRFIAGKTMKSFLILAMAFISMSAFTTKGGTETVEITTSAICGECKERIETALYNQKGVKIAELNMETKVVTVIYSPKKTDVAALKTAITKAGYSADEIPADVDAFNKLPRCCQVDLGY